MDASLFSPLAVIGMGCRLPGSPNLDAYWSLISEQRSAWGPLDSSRFDPALYYSPQKGIPGKSYSQIGGVVERLPFRYERYNLSESVVEGTDETHLHFLETVSDALEYGGIDPESLRRARAGVYVGHARGSPRSSEVVYSTHCIDLALKLRENPLFQALPPNQQASVVDAIVDRVRAQYPYRSLKDLDLNANRVATLVSQAYGLDGPSFAVDGACASSVMALHLAAQALAHRRIDVAIVGGCSYSSWSSLILFSYAQSVTATGSFPFDERADGLVSSDGYACVIVKRLEDALRGGDRIIGVVRGLGVATDGRGKSLWAPRKEGQIKAISRAYGPHLDPATIQSVEAHGTSTRVGDATEFEALTTSLGPLLGDGRRVPIQSVKANIGHTRETAGVAGLIKMLLAMRHGTIPAATNFETPSPDIAWDATPFYVPTRPIAWPDPADGTPRRGVVDAFGIGGINVHLVVDDRPTEQELSAARVLGGATPTAARPIAQSTDRSEPKTEGGTGVEHGEPAAKNDTPPEPIAIVGAGAIFPGARTFEALRELFRSRRDPKQAVPPERWDPALYRSVTRNHLPETIIGGFVTDFEYDWRTNKIPPRQVANADPLQFMILDAAEQALRSAGWPERPFDRTRCGVVVGTEFRSDFTVQLTLGLRASEFGRSLKAVLLEHGLSEQAAAALSDSHAEQLLKSCPALVDEAGSYTASTLASRISKTFDLMGGALTLDAGECSSAAALLCGIDQLRAGSVDSVLCAGGQRALDVCAYLSYAINGLLSPNADAASVIPGEGAAVVLLKRHTDAVRDGDPILAVIRGGGVASHRGQNAAAISAALSRSLADAHTPPDTLSAVEAAAWGAATLDGDELAGIAAVLESSPATRQGRRPAAIDAATCQLGHTAGAAGLAALLRGVCSLQDRRLFGSPTQRLLSVTPDGRLKPAESPASLEASDGAPLRMGVNSFGTDGQAYHFVLEPAAERPAPIRVQPSHDRTRCHILRLGAQSIEELEGTLSELAGNPGSASRFRKFRPDDRVRLAFVMEDGSELTGRIPLAQQLLHNRAMQSAAETQGVFFGNPGQSPPQVAFLFAGQGSQYAGMLRSLVEEHSAARAQLDEINTELARAGLPSFEQIAWEQTDQLGTDVLRTQLAVLTADVLLDRTLRAAGMAPDVISDHSYGEYAALVSAGAWTLADAIRATRARCDAIQGLAADAGAMWASTAPRTAVTELIAKMHLVSTAFVGNHNAPDQTVISGRTDACRALATQLAQAGYQTKQLAVPAPFHSPLMSSVRPSLRESLKALRIRPPRVPFLSSVTNRYVADPDDVRDNLVEQLERPVEFVDLVRRLVDDGVTALVEVGPGQVLTRLARRILEGRDVLVIGCDHAKTAGPVSLARLSAALQCIGALDNAAFNSGRRSSAQSDSADSRPPLAARGLSGDAAAIVHFDATERRRTRTRQQAAGRDGALSGTRAAPDSAAAADELDLFLVNFVCEQTGYPPELVGLDSDLEAELGIDSIKKAQLLGELRSHFPIEAEAGHLSLDDFPTLRHIAAFIRRAQGGQTPNLGGETKAAAPSGTVAGTGNRATAVHTAARAAPRDSIPGFHRSAEQILNVRYFSGSAREIGRQHGAAEADAIRTTMLRFVELVGGEQLDDPNLRRALEAPEDYLGPDGVEEIRGLAEAVGVPDRFFALFNFGLILPISELRLGCSQLAATARANGSEGLVHGANEDWNLGRLLQGTFRRIAQVRRQDGCIPCLTFGACGQIGGLNGINAAGLAVTSTALLDRSTKPNSNPGLVHFRLTLALLQGAHTIDEAIDLARQLPRKGAWSLCLSDHKADRVAYLEYDEQHVEVRMIDDRCCSTNHCVSFAPDAETPDQSQQRLKRLRELLDGSDGAPLTVARAQSALRDQYDERFGRVTPHPTKFTIRQPDTQLSLVLRPAHNELWATADVAAPDDPHTFHRLDLGLLFGSEAGQTATEPASKCGRIMSRFVLRMSDAPLEPSERRPLAGRALIVGTTPLAEALCAELGRRQVEAVTMPDLDDPEAAVAQLDQLWHEQPIHHLLLVPRVECEAATEWSRQLIARVMVPYRLCQHWTSLVHKAGLVAQSSVTAAAALGGDFGCSGSATSVLGGGLAGLLKSIKQELDELTVKVIDAPGEDPPALVANRIVEELTAGAREREVAYVRGRRRIIRPAPHPLPNAAAADAHKPLTPGGAWIITGGARGVTSVLALALGRRFGLKLNLLGTSPAPRIPDEWRRLTADERRALKATTVREAREAGRDPNEAWRAIERAIELDANLQKFRDAGIDAVYHACDITDRAQLARTLEHIRQSQGPIHGVMHGAGLESACRFEKKQFDMVRRTIDSKVGGGLHLFDLTRGDPLEAFVCFGSISGRFGSQGQTDYALASDMLAKLAARCRRERPDCRAMLIHWPAWGEVGMAVRPESRIAIEMSGQKFMPVEEGIAHLFDEIAAGFPEPEILLTEWPNSGGFGRLPITPDETHAIQNAAPRLAETPLLRVIRHIEPGRSVTAEVRFDPQRDPFLAQHRLLGAGVLPAVVAVELMAQATALVCPGRRITGVRNLEVHSAWRFHSGRPEEGLVTATLRDDGAVDGELRGDFRNRDGVITDPSRRFVSAEVVLDGRSDPVYEWVEPTTEWRPMVFDDEAKRSSEGAVWHGPVFQDLKVLTRKEHTMWGRIIASDVAAIHAERARSRWWFPVAVFDSCLQTCGTLAYLAFKEVYLPLGLQEVRLHALPETSEECHILATCRDRTDKSIDFDFTLFGAGNRPLLSVCGYRGVLVHKLGDA